MRFFLSTCATLFSELGVAPSSNDHVWKRRRTMESYSGSLIIFSGKPDDGRTSPSTSPSVHLVGADEDDDSPSLQVLSRWYPSLFKDSNWAFFSTASWESVRRFLVLSTLLCVIACSTLLVLDYSRILTEHSWTGFFSTIGEHRPNQN